MRDFAYERASSVEGAVNAAGADAKFLGGGTNLIDLMKEFVETPARLVDVNHLPLRSVEKKADGGLRIGALVTNSALAAHPEILARYPLVSEAILAGASPQLRNMATTGGNLLQRTRCYYFYDVGTPCNKRAPGTGCGAREGQNRIHAILGASDSCVATHPSDFCVALAALDATVVVRGKNGERTIPFRDFHRLPGNSPERDTNLEPGELILAVDLPPEDFSKARAYIKVRDRWSYAFALVSAAVAVQLEQGKIQRARIALGGVAHKPWRVTEAEDTLRGKDPVPENFRAAAERLVEGAKGLEHNAFKIELARRVVVRALGQACGEAS